MDFLRNHQYLWTTKEQYQYQEFEESINPINSACSRHSEQDYFSSRLSGFADNLK